MNLSQFAPRLAVSVLSSRPLDRFSHFIFSICSDVNYFSHSTKFLECTPSESHLRIVFLSITGDDDARFVASENKAYRATNSPVIIVPFVAPKLDDLLTQHPSLSQRLRINYCRTVRFLLAIQASKYICSTNKKHFTAQHIVVDHDSYIFNSFSSSDLSFLVQHDLVSAFSSSTEEFRLSPSYLPEYPQQAHSNLLEVGPSILSNIDFNGSDIQGSYVLPHSFYKAIFLRYNPSSTLLSLFVKLYRYIALRETDSIDPLTCLWTSYLPIKYLLDMFFRPW